MSFIKSFVTKHIMASAATRPSGQEAVAIFFYGTAPSVGEIAALAGGADVSVGNADSKTRITVSWPDVSTVISIDPAWDKTTQMAGMRNWTERFPARVRELLEVKALVDSFETVTTCYGTVSKPGLDEGGKVIALFKAMIANGGGFFFSRNSFYGGDGLRITGFDEDPVWLSSPPT